MIPFIRKKGEKGNQKLFILHSYTKRFIFTFYDDISSSFSNKKLSQSLNILHQRNYPGIFPFRFQNPVEKLSATNAGNSSDLAHNLYADISVRLEIHVQDIQTVARQ